jgi:hypothetical protein
MKVKVEFEVNIPVEGATEEQIEEWLRFSFGDNGVMENKNPLSNFEPEPIFGTFNWE